MEEIVGQVKWTTTNHTKGRSSTKESDVVYTVRLEGSPLLWTPSGKPPLPLDQLKAALDEKCPELVNRKCIIFHQDNTRPHVSLMTRQKLLQLVWEVLILPPYSPDIAPLYFHLFRSLQNSLNGKNFSSLEDCKRHLEQFFAQKEKVLGRWNYEVAWKMAEGSRTKGWIRRSIKFLVKWKMCLLFLLKNWRHFLAHPKLSCAYNPNVSAITVPSITICVNYDLQQ